MSNYQRDLIHVNVKVENQDLDEHMRIRGIIDNALFEAGFEREGSGGGVGGVDLWFYHTKVV